MLTLALLGLSDNSVFIRPVNFQTFPFSVAEPRFISGKRERDNIELHQLRWICSLHPLYSLGFNRIFGSAVS